MAKSAILALRIVAETAKAIDGLEKTSQSANKVEAALGKAALPAAAAMTALTAMGKAAVNSASELQQATGAVESIFEGQASAVERYAQSAAGSVGLAESQYKSLAAVFGAQLKNMGTSSEELAGQTDNLISLGADLAATFGGTTADAVGAISSLLRGERDPIERYGVSIKAADINARLAAEGLDKLEGEAAKAAETQAVLALLTEQTAGAQGQFARETDTAAGSAQIAAARLEDAKAALGEKLLPVVADATEKLGELTLFVTENSDTVLAAGLVIAGFSAAILAANAAVKIYHTTTTAITLAKQGWTAAQVALNAVMAANPVGVVIAAITALVAIVIVAYQKSETFRNVVNTVWDAMRSGAATIAGAFQPVVYWLDRITNAAWGVWNAIRSAFSFQAPAWLSKVTGWFSGADDGSLSIAASGYMSLPSLFAGLPALGNPNQPPPVQQITINISGALDPVAVGRQVQRALDTTSNLSVRSI